MADNNYMTFKNVVNIMKYLNTWFYIQCFNVFGQNLKDFPLVNDNITGIILPS